MRKGFLAVTDTISLFVDDISAVEKGDGSNFAFKFFFRGGQTLTIETCLPEAGKKLLDLFFEKTGPIAATNTMPGRKLNI